MISVLNILAQNTGIEVIIIVVFLVIGLIAQAIKKAAEKQEQQRRGRQVRRRPAQAQPVEEAEGPRRPRPTLARHPVPSPTRQPVPPPAPSGPARDEILDRLRKLQAKMEQGQSGLARLAAQRQDLLRQLDVAEAAGGLDEETRRVLSDATRPPIFAAAFAQLAGAPTGRAGLSLMFASREQVRLAILYHEILGPPAALRQQQAGAWDAA